MSPMFDGDFDRDAERLSERLDGFADDPDGLRDAFLQRHVHKLYAELTDNGNDGLRADDLVYAAAERVPGLAPSWAEVARERERLQKDKEGYEVAQGTLLGHVLANEGTGRHLIDVMLRPTQLALDHRAEFERTGQVDLGTAALARTGNVGTVELRNPRHLNAEDDTTTGPFEAGIDLLILDPQVEIAVLRGGVVEHPRYAGRRIFGAGLNLTHLYRGQISYLFFAVRDLGLVHKVYRGLSQPETEKVWIAAAETFAIGGGCQLLLPSTTSSPSRAAAARCPRATRASSPAPPTCGSRASSATAARARRSSPTASWRPEELARRHRRARRDGRHDRAHRRASRQRGRGVGRRQPARAARRQEPLDIFRAYMATYCARAGRLPLQPRADPQPGGELALPMTPSGSSVRRASSARRSSSSACRRLSRACSTPSAPARAAARRRVRCRGHPPPRRPAPAAVHRQGRPARALPARPAGGAARGGGGIHASSGTRRQADRGRLHPSATSTSGRGDGALPGDGRRDGAGCVVHNAIRLRPLHRRARLPPGRRADRRDGDAGLGRLHRAPGRRCCATCGRAGRSAPPRRTRCTSRKRWPRQGLGPDDLALEVGVFGGEPWTEACARDRARARPEGREHLRPVGDHRARRGGRVPRGARRAARQRGPLPRRGRRSGDRRAARRGRRGRARLHHADQGGAAAAALPHGRHRRR